ncbi:MAG TPA: CHRD domain-containing protein, partial [Nitrososphaeraceae archaeon]
KHADTTYGMIIRGNITDSSLQGPVQGKILGDLISLMNSGDTYVNILTLTHPDGEIRGQIQNTEGPNSTSVGMSTLTE